ncbi:hypothetical protein BTUL_0168g00230 [Botrytis tulipae]|uniref:Uncharacterized protein n=1 Tax=Botrytis tulipae TaxID=87230 RepID=A0A4Z1EB15_9HELO|nr:hypothetical protein BTUL_0168g00230 [Botrytis tulipae]
MKGLVWIWNLISRNKQREELSRSDAGRYGVHRHKFMRKSGSSTTPTPTPRSVRAEKRLDDRNLPAMNCLNRDN